MTDRAQRMTLLEIDEFALEKEWLRQSKLYYEWASKAADAKKDYTNAKNGLALVKAEVDYDVRSNPEAFGIEVKLTEKVVDGATIQDNRYVRALQKETEAKHVQDVLDAFVKGLDGKKTALSKLVDLHLASYYSEPRTRANRDEVEEMKKDQAWKPKRTRGRKVESDG